ncbi:MAG: heme exporter protein CcmD [Thermaurantiacus tibetensis]|nr:heme exporter protein CcmD [Thermaurantiacus tibetensis]
MNHLPFIVAAYLVTLVVIGGLALASWRRMRRAEREE